MDEVQAAFLDERAVVVIGPGKDVAGLLTSFFQVMSGNQNDRLSQYINIHQLQRSNTQFRNASRSICALYTIDVFLNYTIIYLPLSR